MSMTPHFFNVELDVLRSSMDYLYSAMLVKKGLPHQPFRQGFVIVRGSWVEVGHGVSGGRRRRWRTGPLYGVSHHGRFTRFTHVAHLADSSANVIDNSATHATAHGTTDVSAHVPASVVTAAAARTTASATTIPGVRGRVIVLSGVPLRYCQLFVLDGQTLYLPIEKDPFEWFEQILENVLGKRSNVNME